MLVATVVFSGMAWNVPVSKRLYHVVTTMIVVFASLSYFAMASGHGISYHRVTVKEQHKHGKLEKLQFRHYAKLTFRQSPTLSATSTARSTGPATSTGPSQPRSCSSTCASSRA